MESRHVFQKRAIVGVAFLFVVLPIYGHAILISATPAVGQGLKGPNIPVTLQFNSRIDAKRSTLTLVLPDGGQRTLDINAGASPNSLTSQANGLVQGAYILHWQVLAADGHITRGQVPFRIR